MRLEPDQIQPLPSPSLRRPCRCLALVITLPFVLTRTRPWSQPSSQPSSQPQVRLWAFLCMYLLKGPFLDFYDTFTDFSKRLYSFEANSKFQVGCGIFRLGLGWAWGSS